jgi:hypothetical protein
MLTLHEQATRAYLAGDPNYQALELVADLEATVEKVTGSSAYLDDLACQVPDEDAFSDLVSDLQALVKSTRGDNRALAQQALQRAEELERSLQLMAEESADLIRKLRADLP